MSRILFITGKYLPNPSANGVNVGYIIEELQRRGHNLVCISIRQIEGVPYEVLNETPIYNIKATKYGELLQLSKEGNLNVWKCIYLWWLTLLRKSKSVLIMRKFPNVEPSQSKTAYRLACKLHEQNAFDCVIGVFRPFSGVAAAICMKRKYPNLLCGAYYLDLISGSTKPLFAPRKLYEKLCYEGEIKAFKELDFILMAKGGESTYSDDKYNSVNSKIRYIDFPVFNTKTGKHSIDYDKTKVNLVYAGTLDKNYRNPTYMLQMMEKVNKQISGIVLHIYGRGNCGSIIKKYKCVCSYQSIEHGMVSHDYVLSAMQQADFLINISNSTQNIVPSKIFELFSTGKPILNFISNKNDISKTYFDKYPSVCTLSEWDGVEKQVASLREFILKEKGKHYAIEELQEKFVENTPEFTVNIIEEYLNAHREKYNV